VSFRIHYGQTIIECDDLADCVALVGRLETACVRRPVDTVRVPPRPLAPDAPAEADPEPEPTDREPAEAGRPVARSLSLTPALLIDGVPVKVGQRITTCTACDAHFACGTRGMLPSHCPECRAKEPHTKKPARAFAEDLPIEAQIHAATQGSAR
jgi:hypothetical protein